MLRQTIGTSSNVARDISNGSQYGEGGNHLMLDLSRHAYIMMQTYSTTSFLKLLLVVNNNPVARCAVNPIRELYHSRASSLWTKFEARYVFLTSIIKDKHYHYRKLYCHSCTISFSPHHAVSPFELKDSNRNMKRVCIKRNHIVHKMNLVYVLFFLDLYRRLNEFPSVFS